MRISSIFVKRDSQGRGNPDCIPQMDKDSRAQTLLSITAASIWNNFTDISGITPLA